VAATNLTWIDMAAYLDWAGLRAMTEFEFEKAARGPKFPVPDEFAWGTDSIATKVYTYKNRGTAFEQIEEHYLQDGVTGNAIYDVTQSIGPLRVGIFATSQSDRISAGAGYYGMLDLSGNVFEYVVAVELTQGRSYQGNHGDGLLSFGGEANEQSWPGLRGGIVLDGVGSGLRGGSFRSNFSLLRTSYRDGFIGKGTTNRGDGLGGRGVRSAPTTNQQE
jgi:formylglycine-generating enzyme required for sulfatase activity